MQLSLTLMLLTLSAVSSCGTGYAMDLPNFVFIMTDDQRFDDLGCYGQQTIKVPNIDAGQSIYRVTREKSDRRKRQKKEIKGEQMKQTDHSSELARSELLQSI